jgi:glycosyltransferase involved in cell wall biosynthesis
LPGENRRKIEVNYPAIQPQKSAYKLTICLPTYNGGKFLKAALDSVLNQDFRDFQVIICDDDSRDNTAEIIKDYLGKDERIKYWQNHQRLGLFANWNKCLEYGDSEYVTIFAQDDIMLPNNLSAKIKILDENPRVGLVASSIIQIDDHGEIINSKWAQYETDLLVNGAQWCRENVGKPNQICCPFVVLRKTALESVGNRFNTAYDFAGDYEMWLRIAREWDLYFMQATLGYYRQHNLSETGKQDELHKVAEQIRVWSEWIEELDVPRSEIIELENQAFTNIVEWFTYYLALPYIRKGKLDTAIELSYLIQQWRGRDAKLSILISQLGLEIQNLRGQLDQIGVK